VEFVVLELVLDVREAPIVEHRSADVFQGIA
jgi:hypothetical protein